MVAIYERIHQQEFIEYQKEQVAIQDEAVDEFEETLDEEGIEGVDGVDGLDVETIDEVQEVPE